MPARAAPYPSFTFSRGWALIAKSGKVNRDTLSDWAVCSVVGQSSKQIGIEHFGATTYVAPAQPTKGLMITACGHGSEKDRWKTSPLPGAPGAREGGQNRLFVSISAHDGT